MIGSQFAEKALRCVAVALSLFVLSCAGSTEFYKEVEADVAQGKYELAIETVRKNRKAYGDKSSVLFNLDMGLLYHYAGEPDSSSQYLFAAEQEMDDLYTKSISQAALSVLLNDNVLSYEGEDFEKVMVNVFLALNYASKGMSDDALVEARKVDLKLREYTREYEGKNRYQEDAFIRYIAGVLYESAGEVNDAFISYRKAYEAYGVYAKEYGTPAPGFILDDLVRTASLMTFTEEAERYRLLGGKPYVKEPNPSSTVLLIAYVGRGPIKQEVRPTVSIPDSSGTLHTFQIALPKFVPRYKSSRSYHIALISDSDSTQIASFESTRAQDITAIAGKSLDDRLALIYLKSGGRALLKFLAAEKAKKEMKDDGDKKLKNFLGSLAVDLVVGATEQADTRAWRTLPAEIQVARVNVPPGSYTVSVESSDREYSLRNVKVDARRGRASFVVVDDLR